MKKTFIAATVTIAAAFAFTTLPASADFSDEDMMAVCLVHHSKHKCHAMSHDQMMEMMKCMSGTHHGAC